MAKTKKFEFPTLDMTERSETVFNETAATVVFQNGLLYTKDGRVVPDQIGEDELQTLKIPPKFQYLFRANVAEVADDFSDLEVYEGDDLEEWDLSDLSPDGDDDEEGEEEDEEPLPRRTKHRGVKYEDNEPVKPSKRSIGRRGR